MIIERRNFLLGCTSVLAAPAIVRFENIMPVRVPALVQPIHSLTNILPTLYEAMDIVSREMVGAILAVRRDSVIGVPKGIKFA